MKQSRGGENTPAAPPEAIDAGSVLRSRTNPLSERPRRCWLA